MWRLFASLMSNWSCVGSKARQHWLWYAYNTKNRRCTGLHFWSPNRSNVPGATGTAYTLQHRHADQR
ncbi:IS1 family transposase [Escherichia coli]|uniref:IS1 family transposase n=1 Tax=Escherichia coli TaxID=562 RepID=UPI003D9C75E2